MNKRGDTLLFAIIEMLAAVMIVYLLVSAAHAFATGDIFEKVRKSKDMAIQVDALQSVPGNAYFLNTDLDNYSYYFYEDKLVVAKKIENEPMRAVHYYTMAKGEKMRDVFLKPESLYISGIGGKIKVMQEEPNLLQLSCPVVSTEDTMWGDKPIYTDYDIKDENKKLADAFNDYMASIGYHNINLMEGDISAKETALKQQESDYIYLKSGFGEYTQTENFIKAYIPYDSPDDVKIKSYKLACMIINSIISRDDLSNIDIKGTAIIPVSDDDLLNAAKGKVAVRLEIGNFNTEAGKELAKNYPSVALAIRDAITKYFVAQNE